MRTAREMNLLKKWTTCLGCGRPMWTDRCHRLCRKCRRLRNPEYYHKGKVHLPANGGEQ